MLQEARRKSTADRDRGPRSPTRAAGEAHHPGDRPDDGRARRARAQRRRADHPRADRGLGLPRTTIYRILNTLQQHEVVRRDERGAYHLGRRLLSLAAHVARGPTTSTSAPSASRSSTGSRPSSARASSSRCSTPRASWCWPPPQGRRRVRADRRARPAHADPRRRRRASSCWRTCRPRTLDYWLARPLVAYTARTITDPKRLRAELARIRRQGWAQDRGETAPSIQAFAAPVSRATAGRRGAQRAVPRRRRRPSGWRRSASPRSPRRGAITPRCRSEGPKR